MTHNGFLKSNDCLKVSSKEISREPNKQTLDLLKIGAHSTTSQKKMLVSVIGQLQKQQSIINFVSFAVLCKLETSHFCNLYGIF